MGKKKKSKSHTFSKKGKSNSLVARAKAVKKAVQKRQTVMKREKVAAKKREAKIMQKKVANAKIPLCETETILLIGEGNFSFARCALTKPQHCIFFLTLRQVAVCNIFFLCECHCHVLRCVFYRREKISGTLSACYPVCIFIFLYVCQQDAAEHLKSFNEAGGTVLENVDATRLALVS